MFILGMSVSVINNKQPTSKNGYSQHITYTKQSDISSIIKDNRWKPRKQYQNDSINQLQPIPSPTPIFDQTISNDQNLLAQVDNRPYRSKESVAFHPKQAFAYQPYEKLPTPKKEFRVLNNKSKAVPSTVTKIAKLTKKMPQPVNKPTVVKPPGKKKNIDITNHLKELQIIVNVLEAKEKTKRVTRKKPVDSLKPTNETSNNVDYWQTVYSIESKQGKLLYRPRNKARNCNTTLGPCGHHQLTVQALRDIGCTSMQCRKDRLDYNKSLQLSKKLLALNEKRLRKNGLNNLQGYQKYLIHQQGANGIKNIIAATKGKKELSKTIKRNMANNSPYSYRQFKRMGSKVAAKKFLKHWEKKWISEQRLVLASNSNRTTNSPKNTRVVPTFNDNDLNYALNMMF